MTIQETIANLVHAFREQDIHAPLEIVLEKGEVDRLVYYLKAFVSTPFLSDEKEPVHLRYHGIKFTDQRTKGVRNG